MNFKVGQIWGDRDDKRWTILSIGAVGLYAVIARSESGMVEDFCPITGRYDLKADETCMDLVTLIKDVSKKTLNFWEAREAALGGKKVRVCGGVLNYTGTFFQNAHSYGRDKIEADWEIVEEPKNKTYVVTIYNNYLAEPGGGLVDCRKHGAPLNQIALTVDENGKFVEGRNV